MENSSIPVLSLQQENIFLIDWLTVVFHNDTPLSLKAKLGLLDSSIDWSSEQTFINGYPMQDSFCSITIGWGADDSQYYKNADKARTDMGICLNMSGQGCRAFEEYSDVSWFDLLQRIFQSDGKITRLDLAYDDHSGILDIYRIKYDVENRNYVSKSSLSQFIWSDDQKKDIQGLTIEIGSKQSSVLIRIYNKAAERGFDNSRHWIRVELQLRAQRAQECGKLLFREAHIGRVAAGILRNYCTFRVPTSDSNRSRWPLAYYWEQLLFSMDKLSVWRAPGEPYNFSKTENHVVHQYGQFVQAYMEIHGEIGSLVDRSRKAHPVLHKKYLAAINQAKLDTERLRSERRAQMDEWGLFASDDPLQSDFSEILLPDPECPW